MESLTVIWVSDGRVIGFEEGVLRLICWYATQGVIGLRLRLEVSVICTVQMI